MLVGTLAKCVRLPLGPLAAAPSELLLGSILGLLLDEPLGLLLDKPLVVMRGKMWATLLTPLNIRRQPWGADVKSA